MCSPTTPGANDNASGVAAVLEVARRLASSPFGDTDVLLVFPGGEEVGNTGIRAWLRANRATLEPHTTLVINLDSVGSNGHLVVARRESLTGWLDERDVERALTAAAEIGIPLQLAGIPNATDAVATKQAGLPTISLLSLEDGWISHLHRTSDTLDHVNWNTIVDAVALTEHLAKRWNERSMP
jgi:Zn-dependent M28 family amino/carboxypeptidase